MEPALATGQRLPDRNGRKSPSIQQPDRPDNVNQTDRPGATQHRGPTPRRSGWKLLGVQFVLLLLVTGIFTWFDLDRVISSLFYTPEHGWYLARQPLWVWLHRYGTIPGVVLTLAALLVWLASFGSSRLRSWRRPCLVVVLTTVLAAGFLVNSVLKQYWGRPRPSQTVSYGGNWDYRPIFPPGTPGKGASFPCGHCTMGFVFLAAAAFHNRSRLLSIGGVATGATLGTLLSVGRIVQGAHFTNDAIWSLGIVGMTATTLMLYLPQTEPAAQQISRPPRSRGRKLALLAAGLLAVSLVAGGFLTRRPFFSTYTYPFDLPPGISVVHIALDSDPETFKIAYAGDAPPLLRVDAHGFGWINFDYQLKFNRAVEGNDLWIYLDHQTGSYFAELDHALTLNLPERARRDIRVELAPPQAE
jgi:lipid A 4'-phosphatase